MFKRFLCFSLALVASLVTPASMACTNYSEFSQGQSEFRLSSRADEERPAEGIRRLVQWLQARKAAERAQEDLFNGIPWLSAMPQEYWDFKNFEECYFVQKTIDKAYGKDSALTGTLVLGALASDWKTAAANPVLEALARLRGTFPSQWQSKVAPLVEVRLLACEDLKLQGCQMLVERSMKLLWSELPEKDYKIETDSDQVSSFMSLMPTKLPLRLTYLFTIALIEHRVANELAPSGRMHGAGVACERIRNEYGDDPAAREAIAFCEDHQSR